METDKMKNITLKPFVIMALNLNNPAEEVELLRKAGAKNVKEVAGCYNGIFERSYVLTDFQSLPALWELAAEYNQESILYVDADRKATLHYIDDNLMIKETVLLGKFRGVPEETARKFDSRTYAPHTNSWYIVD